MRIRTIKPEWRMNEHLQSLGDAARMMSVSLITLADDYGNGRAGVGYLAGEIWGYELEGNPRDTLAKVSESLAKLSEAGYVTLYEVRGQRYFHINAWNEHQKVDKPGKPRVPKFDEVDCVTITGVREDSENSREDSEKNKKSSRLDLDPDPDHGTPINVKPASAGQCDSAPDPTQEIFDLWASSFDKGSNTQLTSKRKSKIRQRLKRWKPEQLKAAIQNYAHDPWRHEDPVRHELATLLRDDEHVENGLARGNPKANEAFADARPPEAFTQEAADQSDREFEALMARAS